MEGCLQGISCESELTYHPNKPLDPKLLNLYAVKSDNHKKWIRCALVHLIRVNSPNPKADKAVCRMLDYGSWVSISLPGERFSECIQDLPDPETLDLKDTLLYGQYYGYILPRQRRVPFDELKELKDSVVLVLVHDCKPPANGPSFGS